MFTRRLPHISAADPTYDAITDGPFVDSKEVVAGFCVIEAPDLDAAPNDVMAIGSPAPRIPSVIGFTQSEAAQALQAAGYVLGHVAVVIDITCEYIGEVKTQSPAAGTIDPPGTSVSVTIGKVGGKCL